MEKEPIRSLESELAPEFVRNVEELKLDPDDKVNFLLTKAGLKPTSEILLVIKSWYKGELTEHMNEEEIQEALRVIKESGLPFQLEERKVNQESYEDEKEPGIKKFYQREQMKVLMGRSKENLEFLIKATQSGSDELIGKAFGFPDTAVEAFVGKRETLNINSLPKEIRESDAVLFSSPTLSTDNWQEEIKQGERYADFVKKVSPVIYKEMRDIVLKK